MADANASASQFALNQSARIGLDVVISQLIAALSVPGVYEVTLTSPVDGAGVLAISGAPGQWGNCTAINLAQATATERS
jgi:phage-related baseplate assembly protein